MNNWCTIESDPGVFTEMIEKFGVEGVQVRDIYALDDLSYLKTLGEIYGFVFLFKYDSSIIDKEPLSHWD